MTVPAFRDHAANERTFLAWVRTAIAVMAFGFLVERFDIFLIVAGQAAASKVSHYGRHAASLVGLALIVWGAVMIVASLLRYLRNRRAIAAEAKYRDASHAMIVGLAVLLVLLGLGLAFYLGTNIA